MKEKEIEDASYFIFLGSFVNEVVRTDQKTNKKHSLRNISGKQKRFQQTNISEPVTWPQNCTALCLKHGKSQDSP